MGNAAYRRVVVVAGGLLSSVAFGPAPARHRRVGCDIFDEDEHHASVGDLAGGL